MSPPRCRAGMGSLRHCTSNMIVFVFRTYTEEVRCYCGRPEGSLLIVLLFEKVAEGDCVRDKWKLIISKPQPWDNQIQSTIGFAKGHFAPDTAWANHLLEQVVSYLLEKVVSSTGRSGNINPQLVGDTYVDGWWWCYAWLSYFMLGNVWARACHPRTFICQILMYVHVSVCFRQINVAVNDSTYIRRQHSTELRVPNPVAQGNCGCPE